MSKREVPVYLFTGFLGGGKTTYIQEVLENLDFNEDKNTLVIMCEEGEAELFPLNFSSKNVEIVSVSNVEDLTAEYLAKIEEEIDFSKVIIEYNGMWLLDKLYNIMPRSWMIYQEMTMINSQTFLTYNKNMRNLTVDKMKFPELIVFNRFEKNMNKMEFHKIARAINRQCQIIYEDEQGNVEIDEIEDPLPYDLNDSIVEIKDEHFAIWYANMNEEEDQYYGKTLKIRGRTLTEGGLDEDELVIGRHIMTCCVEDIQFGGFVAKHDESINLEHGGWVQLTAKVEKEFNHMYNGQGPVLHVLDMEHIEPLEKDVATFY